MLLFEFPSCYDLSPESPLGSIDEISWLSSDESGSDIQDVPRGAVLYVRGWATNPSKNASATSVVLRVNDEYVYEARIGLPRPDVERVFGNPAFDVSGFEAVVPTGRLREGAYSLDVFVIEPASRHYAKVADTHRFRLRPSGIALPDGQNVVRSTLGNIDEIVDETRGCSILLDAGMATVPRGSLLRLRGWLCAADPLETFSELYLVGVEKVVMRANYGSSRPDVAEDLATEDIAAVGFDVQLPTIDLPRGEHHLEMIGRTANDELITTSVSLRLTIGEGLPARIALPELTAAFIDEVVRVKSGTPLGAAAPLRVVRGDQLFVRGWAFDESAGALAAGVVFVIDENIEIPALYGLDRPDIAINFSNSGLARSGFLCEIETHKLSSGYHNAVCHVLARDGRGALATLQRFAFEVNEGI